MTMICNVSNLIVNVTIEAINRTSTDFDTSAQFNASNGSVTVTGRTSSAKAKVDTYLYGYLNEDEYNYYLAIVEPLRFGLHVLTVPLLLLTIVSFAMSKQPSVSNRFIVVLNTFELVSALANVVLFSLVYTSVATDWINVTWTLVSNVIIVCSRRVVYVLNLFLCVQKLLVVIAPIKSRQSRFLQTGYGFFLAVPMFTFAFHVYLIPMYNVQELRDGVFIQVKSEAYKKNEVIFENLGNFSKVTFSYLPLALSLIANFTLLCYLKRRSRLSKELRATKNEPGRLRQDRQMNLLILVSTTTYTVMSLPANINQLITTYSSTYGTNLQDHYLYLVLRRTVNATQCIGDLTNFISYACLSSSFRQQLTKTVLMVACRTASSPATLATAVNKTDTPRVPVSSVSSINLPASSDPVSSINLPASS